MSVDPIKKPLSEATKLRLARRTVRELKRALAEARAEVKVLERRADDSWYAFYELKQTGNGAVNFLLGHAPFLRVDDRKDAENWAAAWAAEVARGPR